MESAAVDLADRGIDATQAADLRHRLSTFASDWDRPRKWTFTMPTNRGDVVLVLFPDSNLRTAKRRPASWLGKFHRGAIADKEQE